MPRYKLSAEERRGKKEERERIGSLMESLNVKNLDDVQYLFKTMIGAMLENGLEAELEEELGYSKYDYRNKETKKQKIAEMGIVRKS